MSETLNKEQALMAMIFFLGAFYARTKSDHVGGLLGDLMQRTDGSTADPAAWADWLASVRKTLAMPS
jgi:hypothetical protein